MRRRSLTILLCSVLAIAPATAADDDEAFKVDKRSFTKTYRTIALAPVEADPYLQMPEQMATMLEQEITARLVKEKFKVIPSSVLGSIRAEMASRVGGVTDAKTGQQDTAKAQAVREHGFRELWFREQFDALGIIRVSITRAGVESDQVAWDGVKRRLQREGRGRNYTATVAVSSVSLALFDSANRPIYAWYGGLEPLMYRADEQLLPLPPSKLFLDEKIIREAAGVTVDPF